MIYSLRGALIEVSQNFIILECGGVGYGMRTTSRTIGKLPRMGGEARVFTHLSVREDAVELFGFIDQSERSSFQMLTAVNGVGPKAAIAILSELTCEQLMLCVATGDAKSITRAPGVGPKLANRIVLELKDKLSSEDLSGGFEAAAGAAANPQSNAGEAVSALVALGYSQSEAASAVGRFKPETSVQDMIKGALRALSGSK